MRAWGFNQKYTLCGFINKLTSKTGNHFFLRVHTLSPYRLIFLASSLRYKVVVTTSASLTRPACWCTRQNDLKQNHIFRQKEPAAIQSHDAKVLEKTNFKMARMH
ncbi:hypothetical protein IGI04_007837, partial [Brassica rapa subsp. trilocularis]